MFFNVLTHWLRGLLALAIVAAGVLAIVEWLDELPREAAPIRSDVPTASRSWSLPERLAAWRPGPDRSTGLLVAGALMLTFAFTGRWISPRLWRRPQGAKRADLRPRVHALETRHGYVLHLEEYGRGDGQPLLFVHGLASDRTQWAEAVEDLGDEFRVFAFDLLGHGLSAHVEAEHSAEAAAEDLHDVIHFVGADGLVLAGHSMGGMIAMTWVSRHPKLARSLAGLVLVHTTPHKPYATMSPVKLHRALEGPVYVPLLRATPPLAWLMRFLQRLEYWNGTTHWQTAYTAFGGGESREQLDRVARLQSRMDPAAVARYSLALRRFDVQEALAHCHVPTVVVGAEKDPVTRLEASRRIASAIPGASLIVLKGTRHLGYMERRRQLVEAVTRFREEKRPTSAARR